MGSRLYGAIDLKSAYASIECRDLGLDPMTTNLVVADIERTEKTICLAVTPSLKQYGIPGRARLFEVVQKVAEVNAKRKRRAPGHSFTGASHNSRELAASPWLSLDYIVATPRMSRYIEVSTEIYKVYLKYFAPEDIHVYSIDEVMIDLTDYLHTYGLTARELLRNVILDVLATTGITAAAGIGTNLYLAKVAMDIGAKRIPADEYGVRIAQLDETSYRSTLWEHRPLTDFWRIGAGYARKLQENGMMTMGDIARCSMGGPADYHNEELLYRLFGVNAELLIDHAWGYEPVTMADIKAYKPESKSISPGQVLHEPYSFDDAKVVVREITEALALDLLDKEMVTNQIVLTVGYDIENLTDAVRKRNYQGEITTDRYGRKVPKHAHGTANLSRYTSSAMLMVEAASALYDRIVDKALLVRRINMSLNNVLSEAQAPQEDAYEQLDLFTDYGAVQAKRDEEEAMLEREKRRQKAMLEITKKYGNNAILKGTSFQEGATAKDRNKQIGGHRA